MSGMTGVLERLQDILPEDDFLSVQGIEVNNNVGDGCRDSRE